MKQYWSGLAFGLLLILVCGITSPFEEAKGSILTPDGFIAAVIAMIIAALSMSLVFFALFAVLRRRSKLDRDIADAQNRTWVNKV